jgi:hypothetical protein
VLVDQDLPHGPICIECLLHVQGILELGIGDQTMPDQNFAEPQLTGETEVTGRGHPGAPQVSLVPSLLLS